MPELPEVETIRCQLRANIVGKTIKAVEILYPKVLRGISAAEFKRALEGKKIKEVGRQGKLLLIRLQEGKTLVVHLKMTGRLLLEKSPRHFERSGGSGLATVNSGQATRSREAERSHTAVAFTFKNGLQMFFDDVRRFGFMKIVPTENEAEFVQKQKLGIDFFDKALTAQKFKNLIRNRGGSQIKPLLMDQSLIAGIGNIYAQEACFAAKVHPLRKVSTLTDQEFSALHKALGIIMKLAIKRGGSSVDAGYVDVFSRPGKFAPLLKVYGRESKPCLRCKMKLLKKNIGGRGTVWCPKCQK